MTTSGRYGASGVGWLSLVLFWGLAIVGLVLVVWRSRERRAIRAGRQTA